MCLDAVGPEPAGQPETVAAGLKGHRDPLDFVACLLCLLAPPIKEFQ